MGSSHVFSEIFIHVNWHCLHDKPMIQHNIEPAVFQVMTDYCRKYKGIHLMALNGTPTHIHMAFQMEPFVTLSDFVGQIKGFSSFEINRKCARKALLWQRGYGAVSFSKSHSRFICDYIARQKEHHGCDSETGLNATLEISGVFDDEHEAEACEKPR